MVSLQQLAMDPPTAHGGALVPGRYILTAASIYTGTGGATGPAGITAQIESDNDGLHIHHTQRVVDANGTTEDHLAGTFSTTGIALQAQIACPSVYTADYTYDATSTGFTLYQAMPGPRTLEEVFTKQ
jgi:hypothetical protein